MTHSTDTVRPAAVAGTFYPGSAVVLTRALRQLLGDTPPAQENRERPPKAIIAPHAGYAYSGPIAATVYAPLHALRATIRRVVLLGPTHRVAVNGLAVPSVSAFATPLGEVPLDAEAIARIAPLPQIVVSDAAHAMEHSLEVQLPFLQTVLERFTLVPLAVGKASPSEVAEVLETLWGSDETLIVISSDLSHYLPYPRACETDTDTARHIVALDAKLDHQQACGATPVNGLLLAARRHGLRARLLDLRNSGDTAGDKSRVVGYGAFSFTPVSADAHWDLLGSALLVSARNAIAAKFGLSPQPVTPMPELSALGASFVTLTRNGQLRGCIGSLEAHRPLATDVAENAFAAAFHDRRFAPLSEQELPRTRVEVSLLSPAEAFPVRNEEDALARLRPGIDGLILSYGRRRATFLPQVWESLADPRQFMAQLKLKAGLAADFWDPELTLARYGVRKWKET